MFESTTRFEVWFSLELAQEVVSNTSRLLDTSRAVARSENAKQWMNELYKGIIEK